MEMQTLINFALVVIALFLLFLVSRFAMRSAQLKRADELRADHEEQTRMMAKRMSETGTDLRAVKQESAQDEEEPEDQSFEAQRNSLHDPVSTAD